MKKVYFFLLAALTTSCQLKSKSETSQLHDNSKSTCPHEFKDLKERHGDDYNKGPWRVVSAYTCNEITNGKTREEAQNTKSKVEICLMVTEEGYYKVNDSSQYLSSSGLGVVSSSDENLVSYEEVLKSKTGVIRKYEVSFDKSSKKLNLAYSFKQPLLDSLNPFRKWNHEEAFEVACKEYPIEK